MMKYIRALILVFSILEFAFPACAAVRSLDDYGPVDLAAEMKNAKENSEKVVSKYDSSGNPIYDEAYMAGEARMLAMFSYLTNNKWMITRSMLFGFTNIDAAKQELKDTGAFRMLLENETGGSHPISIIFAIPEMIVGPVRNAIGTFVAKTFFKEKYEQKVNTIADKVFNVPYMDASGDTLYKRVRTIGYVLLTVFFIARMACILVKNIITDDRTSDQYGMALEIREVMTYFVILALLMTYTPAMMKFVMWFADTFRDILLGGGGGKDGVTELMNSFMTLSYIKGKILGMYEYSEMNIVQMLFRSGVWLRSLVTWFCYVLCSAVLFVIVILADVMMGITAILTPFILAISILPMSSSWRVNYYHSLFKFSLYIPLAGLYAIIMCYVHTIIPNISFMSFLCISWAFFWAASRIPSMAENLSGMVFASDASKSGKSIALSPFKAARYGASKLGGKDPK